MNLKLKNGSENDYIFKHISFTADGYNHSYTEKLKCIDLELFEHYFKEAGLKIRHVFGNYELENFNKETSDRLILIFQQ